MAAKTTNRRRLPRLPCRFSRAASAVRPASRRRVYSSPGFADGIRGFSMRLLSQERAISPFASPCTGRRAVECAHEPTWPRPRSSRLRQLVCRTEVARRTTGALIYYLLTGEAPGPVPGQHCSPAAGRSESKYPPSGMQGRDSSRRLSTCGTLGDVYELSPRAMAVVRNVASSRLWWRRVDHRCKNVGLESPTEHAESARHVARTIIKSCLRQFTGDERNLNRRGCFS